MFIEEVWTNETEGYGCGESGLYEPFTDNVGKLFKFLQKEYGRCQSSVYVDKDGKAVKVGWYFQKRRKYEDCNEYFLQGTWVTLYESKPDVEVTHHYKEI